MATERDKQELIRLYGKAQNVVQELSFIVAKMPGHFGACATDLRRDKPISVENIEYQGTLLKTRASEALRAIGALHVQVARTFPEQLSQHEEEAA